MIEAWPSLLFSQHKYWLKKVATRGVHSLWRIVGNDTASVHKIRRRPYREPNTMTGHLVIWFKGGFRLERVDCIYRKTKPGRSRTIISLNSIEIHSLPASSPFMASEWSEPRENVRASRDWPAALAWLLATPPNGELARMLRDTWTPWKYMEFCRIPWSYFLRVVLPLLVLTWQKAWLKMPTISGRLS